MSEPYATNTEIAAYSDTVRGFLAAIADKSIKGIYLPSIELVEAVLAQLSEAKLLQIMLYTELDQDYYFDYLNALPANDIVGFYRNNKELAHKYIEGQALRCNVPSVAEHIYNDIDKGYFKDLTLEVVTDAIAVIRRTNNGVLDNQSPTNNAYMAITHTVSTICFTMTAHAYASYIRQLEF